MAIRHAPPGGATRTVGAESVVVFTHPLCRLEIDRDAMLDTHDLEGH
jgi:hypothetical protein